MNAIERYERLIVRIEENQQPLRDELVELGTKDDLTDGEVAYVNELMELVKYSDLVANVARVSILILKEKDMSLTEA